MYICLQPKCGLLKSTSLNCSRLTTSPQAENKPETNGLTPQGGRSTLHKGMMLFVYLSKEMVLK